MNKGHILALAAAAVIAALAGCSDPAPVQSGPSAATAPAKPKAAELPSQMVAAVAAGKTSDAVSLHFALGSPPRVSTPLPVQIAIVPHQPFVSLSVHFESHDGLTIPVGGDFGPESDVEPDKPISHELMLLPGKEGMFMVTASVETVGQDGNVVRIFSIPVVVGGASATPASAPK
jgi:hypothetical protein